MAAPALGVCRQALRLSHRTQWLSYRQWQTTSQPAQAVRSLSSTTSRREEKGSKGASNAKSTDAQATESEAKSDADNTPYFNEEFYTSLYSNAKDSYLQAAPWERRELEELHSAMYEELGPESDKGRDMEALVERERRDLKEELGPEFYMKPERPQRPPEDFSTMEDPDLDIAPDEEFKDDDLSSLAHAQLDVHREMREYSRLAAWEMPLLSKLVQPFRKPKASTPLKWRYTTYLGTPHPAAHKVVLTFSPDHLGLNPWQQSKLIKLAGPRYDPHKREVKMSSESFPSQAQNKRHLGEQFASLLSEAKNADDKMEDIPFDFRHARKPPVHTFPREWALTEDRRLALEKSRREAREREERNRARPGGLLSGERAIDAARQALLEDEILPGVRAPLPAAAAGEARVPVRR
ncbi:hypothetical protein ANO11243_090680 [Dothideomycetidae sp. 11243]|nr:hypothetical protein ANO11243_090680 [fungal sp. No.11243]